MKKQVVIYPLQYFTLQYTAHVLLPLLRIFFSRTHSRGPLLAASRSSSPNRPGHFRGTSFSRQ